MSPVHPREEDNEAEIDMADTKILLEESEIPAHWYNVIADMPNPPAPPLGPDGRPVAPEVLAAIFPMSLIEQEMSTQRWIEIPESVREIYRLWRPSPLFRAHRLEQALGTPAKIYYKYEGVSPAGSHKPNTAVAQAYYNREAGIHRLVTETGAGQWGSSLAMVGEMLGIEVRVYMVRVSYEQKPFRRSMMQTWGAEVLPSPSRQTESGRKILAEHPDSPGSLGIAISEAVEEAASRKDTNYSLGSVLNHVLLHQTVIGLEAKKQFEKVGDYPDLVFASCGGGSNFGGAAFPFFADKAAGKKIRLVAVEPSSYPTLTRGHYAYDFGDAVGHTPMMLIIRSVTISCHQGFTREDYAIMETLHWCRNFTKKAWLTRWRSPSSPPSKRGYCSRAAKGSLPLQSPIMQFVRVWTTFLRLLRGNVFAYPR